MCLFRQRFVMESLLAAKGPQGQENFISTGSGFPNQAT
jgi:hypothetical protein